MTMLHGVRRALLGGRRRPVFMFDPALAVFAEAMAARTGTLFAAAPIVQGNLDGTGTPDVLSFGRGSQVHDNFYECFDPYQGSVATIWTPEKDRDAAETDDEYLFYASSTYWLRYEHDNALLRAQIGTQEFTRGHTSVAGTTYSVVVRWDRQNKLDGTNYGCISVNDAHTFGATTQPTVAAPGATEYIGSNAGTTLPANAVLEALCGARIPFFDGAYGVDINGAGTDIINEFYNGGSYEDLAKLIPAWHFPSFVPTDATPGQLDPTGQMWGWDYGANVLGLGDGHCSDTYGGSNWATEGTPSDGPKDIASTVDQIFGAQGYQWTCDAADEGVEFGLTGLDAGENFLLVVDAHEEGVTTSGAEILVNEGFETGGTGGDYNGGAELDDGTSDSISSWNPGNVDDGAGNKIEGTATVHGGAAAIKFTRTTAQPSLWQGKAVVPGARYKLSFWTRGDGAKQGRYCIRDRSNAVNIVSETNTGVAGVVYTEVSVYFTAPRACVLVGISIYAPTAAGVCYFDDVSLKLVADDIRIAIVDDTNGGQLTNFPDWDFGGGSGYVQMAEGVVTFELPTNARHGVGADCTAITIKVLGTIAGQTVYLHQASLYPALWDDPSFEANVAPTNVGTPTTSARDAGQAHSGGFSWKVIADAADEGIKRAITTTSGKFYLASGWVYADTAGTVDMEGPTSHTGSAAQATTTANDVWQHLFFVFRATGASTDLQFTSNGAQTFYVDDVSVVELRAITLTVTARTKANSTEGEWLTIDGYDSAPQPIPPGAITATRGHVKIKLKPRHDIADMRGFGETTPWFFRLWADAFDYIALWVPVANTVRLRFDDGGGAHMGDWAAAGALVADVEYLFEIKWNSVRMWLIVDGVTQITINQPPRFAVVPTQWWIGTHQGGAGQIDMAFAKP